MSRSHRVKAVVAVGGFLLVAGSAAGYFASTRRDVTTSSAEAYTAFQRGRENEEKLYYKEASLSYAEALARDPEFVMAMVRLAALSREKDPARAKSLLQVASRRRDSVSSRERLIIDIFQELVVSQNKARTDALVEEYVRAYPKRSEGYNLKGMSLMREGRTEEAMEVFHHLLAVNPNNAIAYNLIGYYWMGRGDFAQAEDNLKRYRFLAPDQANPYDSLGEMYANIGRYEEADEALGKALQLKPDFVASVGHLGTVAVGRGNFALAAEKFHHAAALSDDLGQSTQFQLAEAMSIFRTKGPKEALTLLDTLPVLSVEASNGSTKEAKALVVLVRAALSGEELSPEAVSQPEAIPAGGVAQKSGKARRHDSAVAARLIQAIRRAEKGDLAPGREATAKELPAFAETVGEFSFFPYFPLLWVDLADRLGKGGAIGEASEILKVILARNSKFQPALDVQAAIRGEAGAKKALSSPPGA